MALPPPQPRDPGFPPRHNMTFGEVVSSYNMFGNSAAKRHSHMTFHQHTHLPDRECTVHDKVACLRDSNKDPLRSSWSSSSRPNLTPRWSARSRTPSPWAPSRRHRSLPSTPRASTPNQLRHSDPRFVKDTWEPGDPPGGRGGSPGAYGSYRGYAGGDTFAADSYAVDSFDCMARGHQHDGAGAVGSTGTAALGECPSPRSPPARHGGGRYSGSHLGHTSHALAENALAAADTRPTGLSPRWTGNVGGSSALRSKSCGGYGGSSLDSLYREGRASSSTAYSSAKMSRPVERLQHQAGGSKPGAMGPSWTRGELEPPAGEKDMGTWTARIYTKEQQQRLQVDEFGAPAMRSSGEPRTPPVQHRTDLRSSGAPRASAEASVGDPRSASFVRLNSFLLRTHITSLVSALAEDGWLEAWEKERLCSQAREDSPAWVNSFFRVYMRFLESEDVRSFVTSLRSQIV